MKKITMVLVLCTFISVFESPAFAATTTFPSIAVNASVGSALSLTVVMKKNDFAGATVTTMDFGQLVNIGTGTLRSSPTGSTGTGAVALFVTGNSQGAPYSIVSTGSALNSGANSLPAGALCVVPIYAAADNAGAVQPAGSVLGTKGSWVGTRTLYTSESGTAAIRTIQNIYSVTDDPAAGSTAGVPVSQPAGSYTGTVTITMTS